MSKRLRSVVVSVTLILACAGCGFAQSVNALEVWAGNTDYRGMPNAHEYYYNIDKHGYTRVGGTNQSSSSVTFSNGTVYNYYVVVSRTMVQIDTIQASNGSYIPGVYFTGNTNNPQSIGGPPDGQYGTMGTNGGSCSFLSYLVIPNTSSWTGITVYVGSISPLRLLEIVRTVRCAAGGSTPYSCEAEIKAYGMMDSVSVVTPSGRICFLSRDIDDSSLTPRQYHYFDFDTEQQMEAAFGSGTYSIVAHSVLGDLSTQFNALMPPCPTQTPTSLSPAMGQTDVAPNTLLEWHAITDPSVDALSLWVEDAFGGNQWDTLGLSQTSYGPLSLLPASNYWWTLSCTSQTTGQNGDGIPYSASSSREAAALFRTAGGGPATADLAITSLSPASQIYRPGDTIWGTIVGGNFGSGNAIGSLGGQFAPVHFEVRLSRNQVWGDSDDILIERSYEAGVLGNQVWHQFSAAISSQVFSGQYYLGLMVDVDNVVAETDESNNLCWSDSQITIVNDGLTTIPGAKLLPDGAQIELQGVAVSKAWPDYYYVQGRDGTSGIRVESAGHGLAEGSEVDVCGTVTTNSDGERCISASLAYASAGDSVRPLGMRNSALGGGDWCYQTGSSVGQQGIKGCYGLNNIGLLVRTWGKVTASGIDPRAHVCWFYIDDGSAVKDGTGFVGVYCEADSTVIPPQVGSYVSVTGASGCEFFGADLVNVLRVRQQADISPTSASSQ